MMQKYNHKCYSLPYKNEYHLLFKKNKYNNKSRALTYCELVSEFVQKYHRIKQGISERHDKCCNIGI